jgi:hypothetical protein
MSPTPLIIDFFLGLLASTLSRWPVLRFMAWWMIPLIVALIAVDARNFLEGGESGGWAVVGFVYSFLLGLITSGVGTLFGLFVRRSLRTK